MKAIEGVGFLPSQPFLTCMMTVASRWAIGRKMPLKMPPFRIARGTSVLAGTTGVTGVITRQAVSATNLQEWDALSISDIGLSNGERREHKTQIEAP